MGLIYRINDWINKRKEYKRKMAMLPMFYNNRDEIILGSFDRRTVPNSVNLHYWSNGKYENLGDYLSKVIVEHFAPTTDWSADRTKHLYAIGSILGLGCQDAVVWGSGLLYLYKPYLERMKLADPDVRCVRGPLTRKQLLKAGKSCPEIYGDPAVLMPMIYKPDITDKEYEVSFIKHIGDNRPCQLHTISMRTTDHEHVINEIVRSKKVISSALHGIILAEAYGIPAVLCPLKGWSKFKYRDYYYSTGRYKFPIARSVEEALETKPCPLPDLTGLRDNLLRTFPYDLWEG